MTGKQLGEKAAFPRTGNDYSDGFNSRTFHHGQTGMTIRMRFAMAAMEAILSSNAPMPRQTSAEDVDAIVAREAVHSADALLEELAKGMS